MLSHWMRLKRIMQQPNSDFSKIKQYARCKYILFIAENIFLLIFLFVFLKNGYSLNLAGWLKERFQSNYAVIFLYLFVSLAAFSIFDLPLYFYRTFRLEHKFLLSRQKFGHWLIDQLKAGFINYFIFLFLSFTFLFCLKSFPKLWWLATAFFWLLGSFLLTRLFPIIIVPLFFRYRRIQDDSLRDSILALAKKMGLKVIDVFEIDFSKKTVKANAAFLGLGSTKRIILADTLRLNFSIREIEAILAHEFAHFKLGHLLKLFWLESVTTVGLLLVIFVTNKPVLGYFGLSSLTELASLPLVLFYFAVGDVFLKPLRNFFSRMFERQADALALRTTQDKEGFVFMLDRLANQNMADRNPSRWVKIYFLDHPPIEERIKLAQKLAF